MMKLINSRGLKLFLTLLAVSVLTSPVWAVLEVTLNESVAIDRIQYYWAGETNSANQAGRIINSNPAISFDLSDINRQAKPKAAPPTNVYIFGADASYPNSETTRIRVWSTTAQQNNATYTALSSFSNPAATGAFENLNINYLYIKAKPDTATITQYTESGTVYISPPQPPAVTVTFNSTSPQVGGYTVEIAQSEWELVQGATTVYQTVNGKNLTLDTASPPPGITMGGGDEITLRVKHINLWNEKADNWSVPLLYSVGGGGIGGGPVDLKVKRVASTGLGISSFAVPKSICSVTDTLKNAAPVAVTTTTVSNGLELVELLNEINGGPVVRTFGTWDEDAQIEKGVVVTYSGSAVDAASQTALGTEFPSLVPGRGYQVYVKPDPDADVTLEFTLQ